MGLQIHFVEVEGKYLILLRLTLSLLKGTHKVLVLIVLKNVSILIINKQQ